ncbi:MAG: tetratricopeptide repeat protein [bacterium]|nr:tetratricopeptide repeat protein [bacterium]
MKKDAEKVFISKIPASGPFFLGRENELKILDEAWEDDQTHIVTLVARGGEGKTAVVNEWLEGLKKDDYRGAELVYGWSFCSQGWSVEKHISSDEFMEDVLEWLNTPEHANFSPWEKGKLLADTLRNKKAILILDGLDPLQFLSGESHEYVKDVALQELLKEMLGDDWQGLCIVTTRLKVRDLEYAPEKSRQIALPPFQPETGAQLLSQLGVKGTTPQLEEAAKEFDNHALPVNLVGSYLVSAHQGDIDKLNVIPALQGEDKTGCHARRVLESFEEFLSGKPGLDVLKMVGLFNRPAEPGAIKALRSHSPIEGLTTLLQDLSETQWDTLLKELSDLNLLSTHNLPTLETHPLVREYFGDSLKKNNPFAWQQGHACLYEYYKDLPAQKFPDTLKEMEPLFSAVSHGCKAGLAKEALDGVYWERIRRRKSAFDIYKLGAFGSDLSSLSVFFESPWEIPLKELDELRKAHIFSWVGSRLRPLGRLQEALFPMKAALDSFVKQERWKDAAINASNLSEVYLMLGEVKKAVETARTAVENADNSGHLFQQMARRSDLADALHHSGNIDDAEKLFLEVEAMQKERQPHYPLLYSLQGYQFCDLLLSQNKYMEVQDRVEQTVEWVGKAGWLLDIALDEISLGRAYRRQALSENGKNFRRAFDCLDLAVDGIRHSGSQHHLPRGLLKRAMYFRENKEFLKARDDLEEAHEVATRSGMKLFLADYHLELSRLCLAENKKDEAATNLETAQKLVNEMGYLRRNPEIQDVRAAI